MRVESLVKDDALTKTSTHSSPVEAKKQTDHVTTLKVSPKGH